MVTPLCRILFEVYHPQISEGRMVSEPLSDFPIQRVKDQEFEFKIQKKSGSPTLMKPRTRTSMVQEFL